MQWALTDAIGSVRGLVSPDGTGLTFLQYNAYGKPLTPGALPLFGFAGREFDAATGLYYNRARWYDPETGRFIGQDPIGLAGGLNRYEYASGSPTSTTDPTGQFPWLLLGGLALFGVGYAASEYSTSIQQNPDAYSKTEKWLAPWLGLTGDAMMLVGGAIAFRGAVGGFSIRGAAAGAGIGGGFGAVNGGVEALITGKPFWPAVGRGFYNGAFAGAIIGGVLPALSGAWQIRALRVGVGLNGLGAVAGTYDAFAQGETGLALWRAGFGAFTTLQLHYLARVSALAQVSNEAAVISRADYPFLQRAARFLSFGRVGLRIAEFEGPDYHRVGGLLGLYRTSSRTRGVTGVVELFSKNPTYGHLFHESLHAFHHFISPPLPFRFAYQRPGLQVATSYRNELFVDRWMRAIFGNILTHGDIATQAAGMNRVNETLPQINLLVSQGRLPFWWRW